MTAIIEYIFPQVKKEEKKETIVKSQRPIKERVREALEGLEKTIKRSEKKDKSQ